MKNLKIFGKINFCLMVIVITMLTVSKPVNAQVYSKTFGLGMISNGQVTMYNTSITISSNGNIHLYSDQLVVQLGGNVTVKVTFYNSSGHPLCSISRPYYLSQGGGFIDDYFSNVIILQNYFKINPGYASMKIY
jgi:hypothetical protein